MMNGDVHHGPRRMISRLLFRVLSRSLGYRRHGAESLAATAVERTDAVQ
jgi:hypothetical protein